MKSAKTTSERTASAISAAADESGLVQALDALLICRRGGGSHQPTWHETQSMWTLANRLECTDELAALVGWRPGDDD